MESVGFGMLSGGIGSVDVYGYDRMRSCWEVACMLPHQLPGDMVSSVQSQLMGVQKTYNHPRPKGKLVYVQLFVVRGCRVNTARTVPV